MHLNFSDCYIFIEILHLYPQRDRTHIRTSVISKISSFFTKKKKRLNVYINNISSDDITGPHKINGFFI